jgi:hypothetical protein
LTVTLKLAGVVAATGSTASQLPLEDKGVTVKSTGTPLLVIDTVWSAGRAAPKRCVKLRFAGVGSKGGGDPILSTSAFVAVCRGVELSVTVNVTLKAPAVAGVPLSAPVTGFKIKVEGKPDALQM